MYFSDDPKYCRVDFWKESGIWYTTEKVMFRSDDYDNTPVHEALRNAINDSDCNDRYKGMIATCLEPYHQFCHPISIIVR